MSLRRDPEKLRAWQRRSKGLARGGGLKRTPLARRGKLAAKRRAEAFGPQAELCRKLPCETCIAVELAAVGGDLTDLVLLSLIEAATLGVEHIGSEPAHVPCRPIGKDSDTGPSCRYHHDEWHTRLGARGHAEKYRIDLRQIRRGLAAWMARRGQ